MGNKLINKLLSYQYYNKLIRKLLFDHPNFGGIEWKLKNYRSFIQQPIITKRKKPGLIGLTNKVYETESFTETIMLEHLLQLPQGGMNMWYSTTSTSKKHFRRSSEVRTNHLCSVHHAHLIKTSKYNLGGNTGATGMDDADALEEHIARLV